MRINDDKSNGEADGSGVEPRTMDLKNWREERQLFLWDERVEHLRRKKKLHVKTETKKTKTTKNPGTPRLCDLLKRKD
jgi:hypothetical protein